MIKLILFLLLLTLPVAGQYVGNSYWFGGCPYSTEACDAIAELDSEPPAAYAAAIANLVDFFVIQGSWDDVDQAVCFNLDTKANSLSDISGNGIDMTEVGSITWTATEGFQGAQSGENYLNTNYQPSTDAVNVLSDDALYGAWIIAGDTRGSGFTYVWGGRDSQSPDKSQVSLFDENGGELDTRIHDDGGAADIAATDLAGGEFILTYRNGTTNSIWMRDGNSLLDLNSSSQPNGGLLEVNIYLFAHNLEGTTSFQSDVKLMFWIVMKASTIDADLDDWKINLSDFKTAIDAI